MQNLKRKARGGPIVIQIFPFSHHGNCMHVVIMIYVHTCSSFGSGIQNFCQKFYNVWHNIWFLHSEHPDDDLLVNERCKQSAWMRRSDTPPYKCVCIDGYEMGRDGMCVEDAAKRSKYTHIVKARKVVAGFIL